MAVNVNLQTLSTLNNQSILTQSNSNFNTLQTALTNALSTNGQSPNQMQSNLDMNNNQILNLPPPGTTNSPARLIDVVSNPTITVPPVGTSGATVGLLNSNKTDSGNNTFTGTTTFSGNSNIGPANFSTPPAFQIGANTLLGNNTGSNANYAQLSVSQVLNMLGISNSVASGNSQGLFNPLSRVLSNVQNQARSIVFIGDSITVGFNGTNSNFSNGYINALQQRLNALNPWPLSPIVPFSDVLDYMSFTGSTSGGTSGPLGKSVILNPGATASVVSGFASFIGVYYKQTSTSTTITITDNQSSVVDTETTTVGINDSILTANTFSFPRNTGANCTYTISNTGSNPIDINGIFISKFTNNQGPLLQVIATSGYSTGNFISPTVLGDIASQTFYNQQPIYVIALGINDITNATTFTTISQYTANLGTITSTIKGLLPNSDFIITFPMLPAGDTYSTNPLGNGTFQQYRTAAANFATANNYDFVDLSLLNMNFNTSLLYADGLHPTNFGYEVLGEYWFNILQLGHLQYDNMLSGISISGGPYSTSTVKAVVRNKRVWLNGTITGGSGTATYPVQIGNCNNLMLVPPTTKFLTCNSSSGTPAPCVIEINNTGGNVFLFNSSSATYPGTICLDGLNYSIEY